MRIKIRNIDIYHPENVVDNNYYYEHFKKQGKELGDFFDMLGQDKRKIIDNEEDTTVSLGIKAAKKCLEGANLKGTDIDLIIFTSQFPEYTVPSQAIYVHNAIEGKKEALAFDLNANCVGMVVAFDTAIKQLQNTKQFKRALVVGADYASKHTNSDSAAIYSYFGDVGCAMILEKEEDGENNIKDVFYSSVTREFDNLRFPFTGLSAIYRDIPKNEKKLALVNPSTEDMAQFGIEAMETLLQNQGLEAKDVSLYCVSQALRPNVERQREHFGLTEDQMPFIGSEYGYTGTSSPFVVLYDALKNGHVKRGDTVLIWSIGAGFTTCGVMFEY